MIAYLSRHIMDLMARGKWYRQVITMRNYFSISPINVLLRHKVIILIFNSSIKFVLLFCFAQRLSDFEQFKRLYSTLKRDGCKGIGALFSRLCFCSVLHWKLLSKSTTKFSNISRLLSLLGFNVWRRYFSGTEPLGRSSLIKVQFSQVSLAFSSHSERATSTVWNFQP